MDAKNFEYLSKKVGRYERLDKLRDRLNSMQQMLVKDACITINVAQVSNAGQDCIGITDMITTTNLEEYDELMREIKDNLIDSIGMKIVEIEEKMKEL